MLPDFLGAKAPLILAHVKKIKKKGKKGKMKRKKKNKKKQRKKQEGEGESQTKAEDEGLRGEEEGSRGGGGERGPRTLAGPKALHLFKLA